MNTRRILFILALVIAIGGITAAAYVYLFPHTPSLTATPGSIEFPLAGQNTASSTETMSNPTIISGGVPITVSKQLVQITAGPVVPGEVVLDGVAGTSTSSPRVSVQYVERQSGNVYSYLSESNTLTRINNKTLPGIQTAAWLPDGSAAYVRYLSGDTLSTINTYILAASSSEGFFLPQDLVDLAVSSKNLLMLASGVNGSIGSVTRADGSHSTTVFSTPLSAVRASFAGKNQYLVFSKPSMSLAGSAYLVDANGHFASLTTQMNGLVALASPSGEWVLVSSAQGGVMSTELVNTATLQIIPLPIATIADKCVWTSDGKSIYCGVPVSPSPSYAYPDDWYQGSISFSDRIWKINIESRFAQLILDFPQVGKGALDAEALAIDKAGSTLVFVNKTDGSLWSYTF